MRTILFIAIFISSVLVDSEAQVQTLAHLDVTIYNPSVKQFFNRYENIDHISVLYKNGEAEIVDVYYRGKEKPIFTERYQLSFDGDQYRISKKYKQFPLPYHTKARLTHFQGIENVADVNIVNNFRITLRSDSLTYHFSFYAYDGKIKPRLNPVDYQPTFKGSVSELTSKLEQSFKQWMPIELTDSVVIVTGIVDEKGSMGPLKLFEGSPSAYSNKVLDFMSREATTWIPKFDGMGIRPRQVKISVRVNKDGSMKVAIL